MIIRRRSKLHGWGVFADQRINKNKRIIDYAADKLGIPQEKTVVNVDRFGNTSSGSIPLALADARAQGRLRDGALVLMTGMGAGLTWGSALIEWTNGKGT